jgi:hypothetical protein
MIVATRGIMSKWLAASIGPPVPSAVMISRIRVRSDHDDVMLFRVPLRRQGFSEELLLPAIVCPFRAHLVTAAAETKGADCTAMSGTRTPTDWQAMADCARATGHTTSGTISEQVMLDIAADYTALAGYDEFVAAARTVLGDD